MSIEYGHSDQLVRLSADSRVVSERWFYDDTMLVGDKGDPSRYVLFIHHALEYLTPKGNQQRRVAHSVLGFPTKAALGRWITEHNAADSGLSGNTPSISFVPPGWESKKRQPPRARTFDVVPATRARSTRPRKPAPPPKHCVDCGQRIGKTSTRCPRCAGKESWRLAQEAVAR